MATISELRRREIETWIARVSTHPTTSMPTVLSKPVSEDEDDVVEVNRPRVGIQTRAQKRTRSDSSPPPAQPRPTTNRRRKAPVPEPSPTPNPPSSRSVSPVSEPGVPAFSEIDATSQFDARSKAGSTATSVPRREQTTEKRKRADLQEELEACIRRIKNTSSTAYDYYEDPKISYKNTPLTHYVFKCKACGKEVPRRIGVMETANLHNHTDRCVQSKPQVESLIDFGLTGVSTKMTPEEVREYCALWVAEDARPFQIVKDRYLRKLFDPQVRKHLPHRTTISKDITRMYEATQKDITERLAKMTGVFHIALDMFQTDNGHDYMGVILFHHKETADGSLTIERFLLECLSYGGEQHVGSALASAVFDVLSKFKIQDRVWGVVCDGAGNNGTMMDSLAEYGLQRLSGPEARLYCMLHVINLAAKAVTRTFRRKRASGETEDLDDVEERDGDIDFDMVEEDVEDVDEDDLHNALSWVLHLQNPRFPLSAHERSKPA